MKYTIKVDQIKRALEAAQQCTSKKHPTLSKINLRDVDGGLEIIGCNSCVAFKTVLPAESTGDGERRQAAIDGKQAIGFLKAAFEITDSVDVEIGWRSVSMSHDSLRLTFEGTDAYPNLDDACYKSFGEDDYSSVIVFSIETLEKLVKAMKTDKVNKVRFKIREPMKVVDVEAEDGSQIVIAPMRY